MDTQRRKLVDNYFKPKPGTPWWPYVRLGAGLLFLIVGAASHQGFVAVIGVVALIWGGYGYTRYLLRVLARRPAATDSQMDNWLKEALLPIATTGRTRLSVHPTEVGSQGDTGDGFLTFVGLPLGERFYIAWGDDKKLRFSLYNVMVVYLSNWRMPVYECVLDMATGATITDATREYHLNQVDGVETSSDRIVLHGNDGKEAPAQANGNPLAHYTRQQQLHLVVSGRTAISLVMSISSDDATYVEVEGSSRSQTDIMIARLREHLRAQHHGTQAERAGLVHNIPGQLDSPPDHGLELPPEPPRGLGGGSASG